MKRKPLRIVMVSLLLISALFAAWAWLRPYSWGADSTARCRVVGCEVAQDYSNHWLRLHLKMLPERKHDLLQPVRLLTAAGRSIEPADTTLSGDGKQATRDLWVKFYLEPGDFTGPLALKINGGELSIRAGHGDPDLGRTKTRYFITNQW